jgi:hypothetical protein
MGESDDRRCQICCEVNCPVDRTAPEPAPFSAVKLPDGSVWVNVPMTLNWNWRNVELGGSYCWDDLLHQTHPDAPEEVSVETWRWRCGQCLAAWPWFDPATAARTWPPGCPSCAPPCPECGEKAWPLVRCGSVGTADGRGDG